MFSIDDTAFEGLVGTSLALRKVIQLVADCWQTLEEVECKHILATLKGTRRVLSGPRGAARRLGLNRSTLHFRMKKLGIVRSFSAISACREDEGHSNYSFGSE